MPNPNVLKMTDPEVEAEFVRLTVDGSATLMADFWQAEVAYRRNKRVTVWIAVLTALILAMTIANVALVAVDVYLRVTQGH